MKNKIEGAFSFSLSLFFLFNYLKYKSQRKYKNDQKNFNLFYINIYYMYTHIYNPINVYSLYYILNILLLNL